MVVGDDIEEEEDARRGRVMKSYDGIRTIVRGCVYKSRTVVHVNQKVGLCKNERVRV